jgi:hypothetical protein
VAAVAILDPEIAANIVQLAMLVTSKRPGIRETHGARPWYAISATPLFDRMYPIRMKRGRQVRIKLFKLLKSRGGIDTR